jgi:hypothetical protein
MARTHSQNADISYDSNPSSTYTKLINITKIHCPEADSKEIQVTDLDSSNDAEEFMQGLINGGTCQITGRFDSAQYSALYTIFKARSTNQRNWRIRFKDGLNGVMTNGTQIVFGAWIQKMGPVVDLDAVIENTITLKVTGIISFTQAVLS